MSNASQQYIDQNNQTAIEMFVKGLVNPLVPNGLRVGFDSVVHVSNLIRSGNIPLAIKVLSEPEWLFTTIGIDSKNLPALERASPIVYKQAAAQSSVIRDLVSQGNFRQDQVDSAVRHFQGIYDLNTKMFKSISLPKGDTRAPWASNNDSMHNEVYPYAVDLIQYAPKFKFLFVVQFDYNDPYRSTDLRKNSVSFVIKSSTRPKVNFEYDDINYYNFRSKVIKQTKYEEMSMKFYDDNKNQAMNFFTSYLKVMSPIANMNSNEAPNTSGSFTEKGMRFESAWSGQDYPGPYKVNKYAASVGPLGDDSTSPETVLSQVTLYHVYNWGQQANIYKFFNPRITAMDLDELAMDSSDPTEFSITFAYDNVFIVPNYSMYDLLHDGKYLFREQTDHGLYPLGYTGSASEKVSDPNMPSGSKIDSGSGSADSSGVTLLAEQVISGSGTATQLAKSLGINSSAYSDFFKTSESIASAANIPFNIPGSGILT